MGAHYLLGSKNMRFNWFFYSALLLTGPLWAEENNAQESAEYAEETSQDETFFAEPKVEQITPNSQEGLLDQRAKIEEKALINPFVISSYKPNYFLPVHYQSNMDGGDISSDGESLDDIEFVFQISIKFPIATHVLGRDSSLWMAYTQKAFWQAYNSDISAPFRETNHEPEIFVMKNIGKSDFAVIPKYISFGFNHNSNGQDGEQSRSWNRVFAELFYETNKTAFSLRAWYRLPEPEDKDDNPDIEKYYGYGEANLLYLIDKYRLSFKVRNNLREDMKGAVQVGFTFPLWGKSQGYIQYFDGYGQSLIEYDKYSRSLGVGIILTNWL